MRRLLTVDLKNRLRELRLRSVNVLFQAYGARIWVNFIEERLSQGWMWVLLRIYWKIYDFLKEDVEIDLNFEVDKETNADDYVYDDFPSNSGFSVEVNNQGEQVTSSLPLDMRYFQISGSPSEDFHPPLETVFDVDVCLEETTFVGDPESFRSPSKDNHHREETEGFCGNDLSVIEAGASQHNVETEVAAQLKELPTLKDVNQEQETEYRQPTLPSDDASMESFLEISNYEFTKSEIACEEVGDEVSDLQKENLYYSPSLLRNNGESKSKCENVDFSRNSTGDCEKLEVMQSNQPKLEISLQKSKSPGTVIQMSNSPAMFPGAALSPSSQRTFGSQQVLQNLSYSSRSHRQQTCSSLERSDLGKEVSSRDNSLGACWQNSASPYESQQGSQHNNNYSVEPHRASPRSYDSHWKCERQDRSRSPTRQRDSFSRHWRDHHYRTRSRSPYKRDHNRRSPRRRYSPRHRSPPSRYHSYHRYPRRQPWSPPHNRSTGLGKPGRNLFVAGFNFITTERDLERKFSRFGRVRDVRVVRDKRTGDSRGFGFLTLERDEDADEAIRALDQTEWNGRIVLVEKTKSH